MRASVYSWLMVAAIFSTQNICRAQMVPPPTPPDSFAKGAIQYSIDRNSDVNGLRSTLFQRARNQVVRDAEKGRPADDMGSVEFRESFVSGDLMQVEVSSFSKAISAKDVLEAYAKKIEQNLKEADTTEAKLGELVEAQRKRADVLANMLAMERSSTIKLAARLKTDLNPTIAAQLRERLEVQLQSTEVELRGLQARRDILEVQLAEMAQRVEKGMGADPKVIEELKKSIDARKRILEAKLAQFAAASITTDVVDAARDQLAQAEAELARYRRSAADAAGGQRIVELRNRLEDTAIELAELSARKEALTELAEPVRQHALELQTKHAELERLEQEYLQAREELDKRRAELESYVPPQVTLMPLD